VAVLSDVLYANHLHLMPDR